ncbi:MAG: hypothetical protein ABI895_00470 [Deltaproteobacteria bacterium]
MGREYRRAVGYAIPRDIHGCAPRPHANDADHDTGLMGHPAVELAVVRPDGDDDPGGELKEVVDVGHQRPIKLDRRGARDDRLVGVELHGVGVAAGRRQRRGHGRLAVEAYRKLGGADGELLERVDAPICAMHQGLRPSRHEEDGLPSSVIVADDAALRHLERLRSLRQVELSHDRIRTHQGHIGHDREFVPGHVQLALCIQIAVALEVDRQQSSAVDHHVETSVDLADCVPELRMVRDAHPNSRQSDAVPIPHLATEHRRALELNGVRVQPRLQGRRAGI